MKVVVFFIICFVSIGAWAELAQTLESSLKDKKLDVNELLDIGQDVSHLANSKSMTEALSQVDIALLLKVGLEYCVYGMAAYGGYKAGKKIKKKARQKSE